MKLARMRDNQIHKTSHLSDPQSSSLPGSLRRSLFVHGLLISVDTFIRGEALRIINISCTHVAVLDFLETDSSKVPPLSCSGRVPRSSSSLVISFLESVLGVLSGF